MSGKTRLDDIQILRFIASAVVLFGHTLLEANKIGIIDPNVHKALDVIPFGGGVDLFFVISGFIIAYVSRPLASTPAAARGFLLKRIIRIVPIYWIMTLAFVTATIFLDKYIRNNVIDLTHLGFSLMFQPYPRPRDGWINPVLGQGWTLNYEMLFYLVSTLFVLAPGRLRSLGVSLAIIALYVVGNYFKESGFYFLFLSYSVIIEFIFGIIAFHIFNAGIRLPLVIGWGMMALGAGLAIVFSAMGASEELRFLARGVPSLLIFVGAVNANAFAILGDPLRRVLVYLGDCSYALYLSHTFVTVALGGIWKVFGLTLLPLFFALAGFGAVAVSVVCYRWLERPVTDRLNAMLIARREGVAFTDSGNGQK